MQAPDGIACSRCGSEVRPFVGLGLPPEWLCVACVDATLAEIGLKLRELRRLRQARLN